MGDTRLAMKTRNAMLEAATASAAEGTGTALVRVYAGTRPATADDAVSGTLLLEYELPEPLFGAVASGTVAAEDITAATAVAAGTASWFRLLDRDGATCWDGDAGGTGSGADMILATPTVTVGQSVPIDNWTLTMPGA